MNEYTYEGQVLYFDDCVEIRWKASTFAPSEKKARNNLTYRYKIDHDYPPYAKITLPGKIKKVA